MRRRTSVVVLAILLAVPSGAAAQNALNQPRVEVGGGAGFFVFLGEGATPSWGPRVTVNFNNQVAVEGGFEINELGHDSYSSWTTGLYLTQAKCTLRAGDATHARIFLVAGLMGLFERERFNDYQYTVDGISVASYPAHTYTDLTWLPTAGIGMEYPLGRHAALRLDTQAAFSEYGVALRFGAGVTIPIGHYGR